MQRRQGRSRFQAQAPCQPAPSAARTQKAAPRPESPRSPRVLRCAARRERDRGEQPSHLGPRGGSKGPAEKARGLRWWGVSGPESPGGTENTPRGRRREDWAEACGETGRHTVGQPGSPRAIEEGRTSHRSVPPRCGELPAH